MWTPLDKDTICAISTAPGVGGIAVIRVSGPEAVTAVRQCTSRLPQELESHRAYFCNFISPKDGSLVDEVVVIFFAKGRSYTQEDTIEISCHGGSVIAQWILGSLTSQGLRVARPGEFTMRAFLNGRMDLTQAEAVLQLIHSQSPQGARVALRQLKGQLSERVSVIEDDLTWVLAHLEANIDFSAEDLESASEEKLISRLKSVVASTRALMASYQAGRIARNGFQVALVGVPNAGKSSLLNALVTEDRAIVSEHPGTTRDFVEVRRTIGGHLFCFVDTAGLRRTEDPIEKLGIEKTRQKIRESDVVLWVQDLTDPSRELSAETLSEACEVLIVKNKCDLVKDLRDEGLLVSARDGSGVEKVVEKLMELAQHKVGEFDAPIMQERQLECLSKIVTSVEKAIGAIENHISPEFIAFDLRESLLAVFELIGKRYDDEILDRVFKEFCLGK